MAELPTIHVNCKCVLIPNINVEINVELPEFIEAFLESLLEDGNDG